MTSLWPWLAVAAVGALHGLNPATGWVFAAACGVRSGDRSQALRALLPIAVGHGASVALVAATVALGLSMDRDVLVVLAAALLVVVALVHVYGHIASRSRARRRAPSSLRRPAGEGWGGGRRESAFRTSSGQTALALWSFVMSTAHGAGLMLVPALIPLCLSSGPGREITASGSLALALAAVGVHTASMLVVTAAVATVACRGFAAGTGWLRSLRRQEN